MKGKEKDVNRYAFVSSFRLDFNSLAGSTTTSLEDSTFHTWISLGRGFTWILLYMSCQYSLNGETLSNNEDAI